MVDIKRDTDDLNWFDTLEIVDSNPRKALELFY